MTRKQKRFSVLAAMLVVIGVAVGLVLTALSDSVAFFQSPTDIMTREPVAGQRIRLGGLVEDGSIQRGPAELVRFRVTDTVETVAVEYSGLLPDLFREGQGVVAEGVIGTDKVFNADTILAKHDENYMPREVVDDMKARGLWQHEPGAQPAPAVSEESGT
ncbi:cytochrome c maturation protein CcmE [Aureimonas fodinaquatilis]|uniref:Cytochrome c-type biogenesis protein CcmE n=1 Tax=Aureimonas fodinaquatilis TaxID=2565783 RepID=A0A5B0DYX7_9HYPH|nr:cytochrome c maturation protein CcmE [Aureimonas fodinaquatilis]KAA0971055.1 cytochrome c maturation protein CcmE [Aureimonas fodinaquatilis]